MLVSVLEKVGDIILNHAYWDCECKENYIRPNTMNQCPICGATRDEQPCSIQSEVLKMQDVVTK